MVIRRMNSMFSRHGRVIFAIITVAIIISFLGFLTPGFTSLFMPSARQMAEGTVFGDRISYEDFRKQTEYNLLFFTVTYGVAMNNSSLNEAAEQQAFPALCNLAAAARRGITVSDLQIAEFIKQLPVFKSRNTGVFDINAYRAFIKNVLRQQGFTAEDLDVAIGKFLIQQELFRQITGVLVTPDELEQFYNEWNEKFDVWAARFKSSSQQSLVKIEEREAENFFNANRDKYRLPAGLKALIVGVGYRECEKEAAAKINDKLTEKFYNAKREEFKDAKGNPEPFEKAKPLARKLLLEQLMKDTAMRKAQSFASEVYDKVAENDIPVAEAAKLFAQLAAKYQLKVYPTGWFTDKTVKIDNKLEEPELVKQIAFAYAKIPVTNAVAGKDAAFVAFLSEKKEARKAEFPEVRQAVVRELTELKAARLAREKAAQSAAAFSKAVDKAAAVKAARGPAFEKIETFILSSPPVGRDGTMIAGLAANTASGAFSPVAETEDGAVLVFVESRVLPPKEDFEKSKKMIEFIYRQKKSNAAQAAFSNWLQSQCKPRK